MAQCPHCLEEKHLAATVCPNCRRDTSFNDHMEYEASSTFIAACFLTLLVAVGYGIYYSGDIWQAIVTDPWEAGKDFVKPAVIFIIQLFE
jgi:uncharacterized protein (DUF983 family)